MVAFLSASCTNGQAVVQGDAVVAIVLAAAWTADSVEIIAADYTSADFDIPMSSIELIANGEADSHRSRPSAVANHGATLKAFSIQLGVVAVKCST